MPEDMTMAVWASKAWMPRKSSFSAAGGVGQRCQVLPSSVVRRTVPSVPEAQAMPLGRAWMPRRLAVVGVGWICHWAWDLFSVRARRRMSVARRAHLRVGLDGGRVVSRCFMGPPPLLDLIGQSLGTVGLRSQLRFEPFERIGEPGCASLQLLLCLHFIRGVKRL